MTVPDAFPYVSAWKWHRYLNYKRNEPLRRFHVGAIFLTKPGRVFILLDLAGHEHKTCKNKKKNKAGKRKDL